MALPNPFYVDENALHKPGTLRLLSYGLTSGQEGVIDAGDCVIKALGTPGAQVQAMPGVYNVRARHLGANKQSYLGDVPIAEPSETISATTSSGGRSDLVIMRVENPYVVGAGTWPEPADKVNGPYVFIRVIEGVANTVWDVKQVNSTWNAITLARIDRPASTGVVNQSHITDLRSLAKLGGTRTVVIENPPVTVPPIASSYYVNFAASAVDPNYSKPTGGTDNTHDYLVADTTTKNWPAAASWQVAVPDWAVECDAEFQVFNAQILNDDVFGDLWLDFGGLTTTAQTYAIDYDGTPGRWIVPYGRTFTIPTSLRGKLITVRTKFKSRFTANGRLDAKTGTTTKLALNFQRKPDPS